jgi:hypothetical protein
MVATLQLEASPVRDTPWRAPTPEAPPPPRRCSRLAGDKTFVSIVDKAVQRKKALNEASGSRQPRRGELVAEDLLAVAIKEGKPLVDGDVRALAKACDLPMGRLSLSLSSPSPAGSP